MSKKTVGIPLKKIKTIALVAHDNTKPELMAWAKANKDKLKEHELVGTGHTAKQIHEATGLRVAGLLPGPYGGDQQIGSMIAEGKIDMLIFFWDPLQAQPHDPDVKALLRVAVTWNILIANNPITADFIISSPYMTEEYTKALPLLDY
ncbi:methylglyoxal synthase [Parafilimonas sp.]|uniref:methylglyoxal synthase n=1 Tax=Parafilimonas sp. TaxID=1969739 RepID=UPI0039E413FB